MDYDVIVVGGGSAGIAAALGAARNKARTLLIESGPIAGGDLISGLPIDGMLNARGEWIVGGIGKELIEKTCNIGGFARALFDWRLMWAVCIDPEYLKLAILGCLEKYQVKVLLQTFCIGVEKDGNLVKGIKIANKQGLQILSAPVIIDCTGDGDICVEAGTPFEKGDKDGNLQAVSLVYRISGVNYRVFGEYIRDNPGDLILGESPVITVSREECARKIYETGFPFAGINAETGNLKSAIAAGEVAPCTALYLYPTSPARMELGCNSTRLAGIDATNTESLSNAMPLFAEQIVSYCKYIFARVPGFRESSLAGVSHKMGVRETRRIMGEAFLSAEDVMEGKKSPGVIAKGGHHIDLHGEKTYQKRIPVKDGKSYDIPYGCLIPRNLDNVYTAGRCISSSREANGSARVMGQCMATGQAAGTAAAMCVELHIRDTRELPLEKLQGRLREQGAILDGTL